MLTILTFVEGFYNAPTGAYKTVLQVIELMKLGSSLLFGLTTPLHDSPARPIFVYIIQSLLKLSYGFLDVLMCSSIC